MPYLFKFSFLEFSFMSSLTEICKLDFSYIPVAVKGYVYYRYVRSLQQAKLTCESINGLLATIRSSTEYGEAYGNMIDRGNVHAFIDAFKGSDDQWRWNNTGQNLTFKWVRFWLRISNCRAFFSMFFSTGIGAPSSWDRAIAARWCRASFQLEQLMLPRANGAPCPAPRATLSSAKCELFRTASCASSIDTPSVRDLRKPCIGVSLHWLPSVFQFSECHTQ